MSTIKYRCTVNLSTYCANSKLIRRKALTVTTLAVAYALAKVRAVEVDVSSQTRLQVEISIDSIGTLNSGCDSVTSLKHVKFNFRLHSIL
ncbi:hypothetical protein K0M31_008383 [Melipona bicolor]|uniref:Uncharacterized protein n=1 Tax=Melipona bicolor TaxID=60889 RepID=A0AA40KKE2_9HYME|nr:hypothetical protein K0M31_008383 [Melipona bicolor]